MTGIIFTSKSLTFAQRMERALLKNGISAKIVRPDIELTNRSCAYGVNVSASFLPEAMEVLNFNRIHPVRVLLSEDGKNFRELKV